MTTEEIAAIGPELKGFMKQFADCFGRCETERHAETYVKGQLSDLPRKNCEPIALRAGVDPRALQKFMGEQKWDGDLMQKHLYEIVARDHMGKQSIGVIDETTFIKKGKKTPGVKRQYCGASGKTDNCTATVHLGIVNGGFSCAGEQRAVLA